MNPFNLAIMPSKADSKSLKVSAPSIIEGADIFDVLCPVSKKTGHRENPLSLLSKVLPPDKSVLASQILQEIPSIRQENPNLSDSDAIDLCVSRFSSGSPYEDGIVRDRLMSVADVLFPDMNPSGVVEDVDPGSAAVDIVDNV